MAGELDFLLLQGAPLQLHCGVAPLPSPHHPHCPRQEHCGLGTSWRTCGAPGEARGKRCCRGCPPPGAPPAMRQPPTAAVPASAAARSLPPPSVRAPAAALSATCPPSFPPPAAWPTQSTSKRARLLSLPPRAACAALLPPLEPPPAPSLRTGVKSVTKNKARSGIFFLWNRLWREPENVWFPQNMCGPATLSRGNPLWHCFLAGSGTDLKGWRRHCEEENSQSLSGTLCGHAQMRSDILMPIRPMRARLVATCWPQGGPRRKVWRARNFFQRAIGSLSWDACVGVFRSEVKLKNIGKPWAQHVVGMDTTKMALVLRDGLKLKPQCAVGAVPHHQGCKVS